MTVIEERTYTPVPDRAPPPPAPAPAPVDENVDESVDAPVASESVDLVDALGNREVMIGFVKGTVIGGLLVFAVCAGITLLAGGGWGPALGVGFFAACWGGPGFGGMLGAVLGFSGAFEH